MKQAVLLSLIASIFLVGCSFEDNSYDSSSESGTGGSTARFTINKDHLYTVDVNNLHTFDISDAKKLNYKGMQYIGYGIETIFPMNDILFLGAKNGMYIYNLTNPDQPRQESYTSHFMSYDPVVVKGDYAYVTLRSWGNNKLQIYNISKINNPTFIKEYDMTAPRGLSVDKNLLFVCDDMLKVYSINNGTELALLHKFNIKANDVIAKEGHLFVIANDGLYQYSYTEEEMVLLSKIPLNYETLENK